MIPPHRLVDTHAHLADPRLLTRWPEVHAAAREAGVERIIAIGTTAADSRAVVALARAHPTDLGAAVGIHPNDAGAATAADWVTITDLATDEVVVALGETGLDRHWDQTPFAIQQDYFDRHLDLAVQLGLPVVIHQRECHRDLIDQLTQLRRPIRGVAHSFTGTAADAEELLDLGLYISFAGMITFANRSLDLLRQAATAIPLDRLLVETDAPYLSPVPHRGQTNEPARVVHTAACLATLRGLDLATLAMITTQNAATLFRRVSIG